MTVELAPRAAVPLGLPQRETIRRLAAGWLLSYSVKNTRDAYGSDLVSWLSWCDLQALDPLSVVRAHIDAYARMLEAQGRAPATVARKLAALASFYGYCEDERVVTRSPVVRVRRPRVGDESQTLGLDRDELRRFFDMAEASGPAEYALVLLLGINGLRVSEALAIDAGDLSTVRGHSTVTITGKGGRADLVPLPPAVRDALDRIGRTEGPFFLGIDGKRLKRNAAARIVARIASLAGITKTISPHSLRHSAITAALDAGVPLRDVQDFARHRSPDTTRRYDLGRNSLDRHASYAVASFLAE